MLRVLITGSQGKIGRVLTSALSNSLEVYGLDKYGKDDERNYKAEISSYSQLSDAFRHIGRLDCIIHLAADASTDAEWDSVLKNNIVGTRNVYECARIYGVRKVVFASSNHVTGGYEGIPPELHEQQNPELITVHHPIRPDSDYGTSKAFGEAVARQYWELYSIRSICLRIGTVLEEDMPQNARHLKTWLSHRDLIHLVIKSIHSTVDFGIYYGVSNNKGRFWDISNAEKELGYSPQDDASKYSHLIQS
ncbi:MAG: NAD-dependent epimerase/dehydratase family protein [Archaeoglobaceae archaeon]